MLRPHFVSEPQTATLFPAIAASEPSESTNRTSSVAQATACFHCGTLCRNFARTLGGKSFCCQGCLAVYELLAESGLDNFYKLGGAAGVRVASNPRQEFFKYLDEPAVRERLVDFADERTTRITLRVPAIHCVACVWLLENLFRLKPGIGRSTVNFPRKEVALAFDSTQLKLSEVVALLTSLGYEPELKFSDLDGGARRPVPRRLWLQLAVAGFAFGNIMLLSISSYFGLDGFSGPALKKLFGYLSMALALPVFFYSAADYWRAASISLRQRLLTIEVPIAAGIVALFAQSVYEVLSGRGEGYFDSLSGLLFFLLAGKLFQQKTYDRLAFDRDYKSFFPLSVARRTGRKEEKISLSQLSVGDRLIIRHGELLPADARLIEGAALIDYSFVTGESEPVEKKAGDHLYAGGRQMGGAIEVETIKAVSQSYLTSLWNQDAFRKDKTDTLDTLTNRYSQRFTKLILAVALMAAVFWLFVDASKAVKAFTSVLIVACPCALALAAPFALGTAQRVLGRRNVFLKSPQVIETLARVNAIVFDKTGTLTAAGTGSVNWRGAALSETEERLLYSMTRHSTHPYAIQIGETIAREHFPETVRSFLETAGCGMEGTVGGREVWIGSAVWLTSRNVSIVESPPPVGSVVHVAFDGAYRGCFSLGSALRSNADQLIRHLSRAYELALLSGDNTRERTRFKALFGDAAELRFNQSPQNKLNFIRQLQAQNKTVLMAGDGLNDAGALKQSDVGVAVVENVSGFSPASDVIMAAGMVARLGEVLGFTKAAVRTVRWSFLISSVYNIVGISIAASGNLSPVVCAILMPLSSVTVVAFACGVTSWQGRKLGGVNS